MSNAEALQPTSVTPGEQIHHYRRRAKISVKDLAAALGVHRNTVAKWERPGDPAEPSVSQARVIAGLLGCRLEDIAGGPIGGGTVSRFRVRPSLGVVEGGRRAPHQRELFPTRPTFLSRVK